MSDSLGVAIKQLMVRRDMEQSHIQWIANGARLVLAGNWTVYGAASLENMIEQRMTTSLDVACVVIDCQQIQALDSAGAWLLNRLCQHLQQRNQPYHLTGLSDNHRSLLALVKPPQVVSVPVVRAARLSRLGRATWQHIEQALQLLAFLGETFVILFRCIIQPRRLRWNALFANVEQSGINALPIIGLLSFLLGIVIGYQAGVQLQLYGANIFIVELVCLTMLRELSPMMAAVIVAGRSGSAFAAQLGSMKVTEEIDAMRTIGIVPMEMLVIPKVLAMLIALPLLTVFADVLGVFGGMVIAKTMLGIDFKDFVARIPEVVTLTSFMLGMMKAPVFALIIAVVGCFQGLRVTGGADSVGRQTTTSVVQAIFLIIVADAIFSIIFSGIGI